jgi:hypothetical protein
VSNAAALVRGINTGRSGGSDDAGPLGQLTTIVCVIAIVAGVAGCSAEDAPSVPTEVQLPSAPTTSSDEDAAPWFDDVTAQTGIDFVHSSGADGRYLMPEAMVGGVALLDVDGDGDLDIYFIQAGDATAPRESRPPESIVSERRELALHRHYGGERER